MEVGDQRNGLRVHLNGLKNNCLWIGDYPSIPDINMMEELLAIFDIRSVRKTMPKEPKGTFLHRRSILFDLQSCARSLK